jgi:hypothetical protein|tara:strand:+ start:1120 stop:1323 length:204 start_codon:yes stop_codon:yes gene_type:complete
MAETTLSFNLKANPEIGQLFDASKKALEKSLGVSITNAQTLGMVLKHFAEESSCTAEIVNSEDRYMG